MSHSINYALCLLIRRTSQEAEDFLASSTSLPHPEVWFRRSPSSAYRDEVEICLVRGPGRAWAQMPHSSQSRLWSRASPMFWTKLPACEQFWPSALRLCAFPPLNDQVTLMLVLRADNEESCEKPLAGKMQFDLLESDMLRGIFKNCSRTSWWASRRLCASCLYAESFAMSFYLLAWIKLCQCVTEGCILSWAIMQIRVVKLLNRLRWYIICYNIKIIGRGLTFPLSRAKPEH